MDHNPEFLAYANEAVHRGHIDNILSLDTYRRQHEIDCTPKEAAQYWYHLLDLLSWALHGYPRDRLARDLHWQAAR